jgi:hypothetical protein
MLARAHDVPLITVEKALTHCEPRDESHFLSGFRVPVASDLGRVGFVGHGIENWLLRKTRRKGTHNWM